MQFETLSIVDVRGDRWTFPSARILGIRDGHLFVEEQTPLADDPAARGFVADDASVDGSMVMSAITKVPLAEIDRVDIETRVDDPTDEDSTTHQALAGAGLLGRDGKVRPD